MQNAIVSDKWVLVVEVKLGSGFGDNQPCREDVVGREMAKDRSISEDLVYYLVRPECT